MTLSHTQRAILTAAAQHPERLACPPARLPTGARRSVAKALLRQGLVIASPGTGHDTAAVWAVDDDQVVLQINDRGLSALTPEAGTSLTAGSITPDIDAKAPVSSPDGNEAVRATPLTQSLRKASTTLLAAWDACPAQDTTDNPISRAVEALRSALQGQRPRADRTASALRQGTKQEAVLNLLRRPEGATIAQIMEATGWQQHTVRGFFAGLKKRQSINVTVLERVRQVGPGAQGSRGSHSIYAVVS